MKQMLSLTMNINLLQLILFLLTYIAVNIKTVLL